MNQDLQNHDDDTRIGRALARARMRARRLRRVSRGFTLPELLVSLTAGLLVTMGIVGLSREATNTFHEEVRTASAESATRTASDRLRADLSRAAFMSTGNIQRDPLIAHAPGNPNVDATVATNFPGIANLAGVRLTLGGSKAGTPLSNAQSPTLNPDMIDIAGNFTSNDQFVVRNIDVAPNAGCQRIYLAVDSPPMWRILATEFSAEGGVSGGANQNLANAFQPVNGAQFIVRIADDTGHFQYVATCGGTATGGASLAAPTPYVDIDLQTPILTAQATKTIGGASGLGSGRILINPVQIVRWKLGASSGALNLSVPEAGVLADANKYDLIRSYVDAKGVEVPSSGEVVAEYAVDLKFAFTVDSSADTTGGAAPGAAGPVLTTYALDDETSNASWSWAQDVKTAYSLPFTKGPQRIRSVRFRLVTRASAADRSKNITVPTVNSATQRFIYRYCAGAVAADGGMPDCTQTNVDQWARARTVVGEAALPNQARMYFL